ncbi:hypothetical protein OCAR_7619 [Afipia carboxidovorans OM5]|nr:hypothetical protein OCAR_7619 [Afipia carboxidovorans OM5]
MLPLIEAGFRQPQSWPQFLDYVASVAAMGLCDPIPSAACVRAPA